MLTKKERLIRDRVIEKLQLRLGGLRYMMRLPELLFIVDVRREHTGVKEANSLNIPILAMVDTNCDPDQIDYVIPANDDAIRAIKLLTGKIADACLEGLAMRKAHGDIGEEEVASARTMEGIDLSKYEEELDEELGGEIPEEEDEAYLGEATLNKLRAGELSFDDEPAVVEPPKPETKKPEPRKKKE